MRQGPHQHHDTRRRISGPRRCCAQGSLLPPPRPHLSSQAPNQARPLLQKPSGRQCFSNLAVRWTHPLDAGAGWAWQPACPTSSGAVSGQEAGQAPPGCPLADRVVHLTGFLPLSYVTVGTAGCHFSSQTNLPEGSLTSHTLQPEAWCSASLSHASPLHQ